jgi:hypothetical protein
MGTKLLRQCVMIAYLPFCITLTISDSHGYTSIKDYHSSIRTTRLFAELFAKSSKLMISSPWSPFLSLIRSDIERVLSIRKFADRSVTLDSRAVGLSSRCLPRLLFSDSPSDKKSDILQHHGWKFCFIIKPHVPSVSSSRKATLRSDISYDTL